MDCKHEWNLEFLCANFTKKYINKDLKSHRENILFERERSYFPATQIIIMNIKKADKVKELIEEQREFMRIARMKIEELEIREYRLRNGRDDDTERTKTLFIRKCPDESCKGFLSSAWKCGICEVRYCAQCNGTKEDDHVCNADDVETMKLLKKDTKPCPHCGTMISKISGCDQMWCPDCHTPFSWRTGMIEKGTIHNPHFYEFSRRNDRVMRNPGDIPCGGFPDAYELLNQYKTLDRKHRLFYIHREVQHIQNHIIRYELTGQEDNTGLRLSYMMDRMTEENFKAALQTRDKSNHKKQDWRGVYQMFVDVMSDTYRQLLLGEATIEELIETALKLKQYCDEQFVKIGKRYNCVAKSIFI